MRRLLIGLVLAMACAGKEGAAGPTGPAGPQGPPGAGATKIVLTGTAVYSSTSGTYGVAIPMPAAAGTDPTRPPAMDCYQTDVPANGVWIAVAGVSSSTNSYCGAVYSGGVWNAVMTRMPPGWTAAFVIAY